MRPRQLPLLTLGLPLAVGLVAGCRSAAPQPSFSSPVQERMREHFAMARDLRTHAVLGDLDELRRVAGGLASLEPAWGMPPNSTSPLDRLHGAAMNTAAAPDLEGATRGAAEVAAACGDCHVEKGADLGRRFVVGEPPPDGSTVRHMARLARTSRLLWDGLVGPSEATWRAGAEELAGDEGFPAPVARHVPQAELERAAQDLRRLGREAADASSSSERVRIVTEVWLSCSGCHREAGIR